MLAGLFVVCGFVCVSISCQQTPSAAALISGGIGGPKLTLSKGNALTQSLPSCIAHIIAEAGKCSSKHIQHCLIGEIHAMDVPPPAQLGKEYRVGTSPTAERFERMRTSTDDEEETRRPIAETAPASAMGAFGADQPKLIGKVPPFSSCQAYCCSLGFAAMHAKSHDGRHQPPCINSLLWPFFAARAASTASKQHLAISTTEKWLHFCCRWR